MQVILVTGARQSGWVEPTADKETQARQQEELRRLIFVEFRKQPTSVLIEGEASGVDKTAAEVARGLGWEVEMWPANWSKYHHRAGPIRNQKMLERALLLQMEGNEVEVHAFHPLGDGVKGLEKSGTADMVARAETAGLKVHYHGPSVESLDNDDQEPV